MSDILLLPIAPKVAEFLSTTMQWNGRQADFERSFRRHRAELTTALDLVASESQRPEPVATNVERLVAGLGLPRAAWRLLGIFVCATRYPTVTNLAYLAVDNAGPMARALSIMADEPLREIEALLSPAGDLVGAGLLAYRDDGMNQQGDLNRIFIPLRVNACLDRTYESFEEMRNAILGAPLSTTIVASDYDHVAADRDLLVGVLAGAAEQGAKGINLLLYGPPGSGKTELAKMAAAAARLTLFAAGEEASHECEQSRSARLADLVFAERLLGPGSRSALLFDEMEDAAAYMWRRGGSKVFLNRLLEQNTVPVVWTSNAVDTIDPALLRRMTVAIELKRPPASQRRKILARLAERVGVALSGDELDRLAQRLDATPAILENALRAARLSGGGTDTIERAAAGIMRAVSGVAARRPGVIPEFDPALARASQDLTVLADRLVGAAARAFSLCMSGPPGTGKSAFARYLARRLGMEVIQKRASDLLGPFVGQTERRIADAFEEAKEAGAMLVFDEADSMLLDRRGAERSWEISQVNEMLTWMEEHPLPVCFTTNLMDRIDQAALRRFTFKIRFHPLTAAQRERMFITEALAGDAAALTEPLRQRLARLEQLCPGDFAAVKRQVDILATTFAPEEFLEQLEAEHRIKPEVREARPMGFVR